MSRQFTSSCTVRELIEALEEQSPDAIVAFSCDYGDYSQTEQVLPIDPECIEDTEIEESAYSDSGFAIAGEPDEDEEPGERQSIIVLRVPVRRRR